MTDQGRRVVDAAVVDHLANEARLLSVLSPNEISALDRALRKLLGQFD